VSFCFLLDSYALGPPYIDLLVNFGEFALGFFRLFLLISPLGLLEHLIYETMESVIVPGLELSLGVKNEDAIQEAFKFTQPGSVFLVAWKLFHHVDGIIRFPIVVLALG
jgi:hypothetical protein